MMNNDYVKKLNEFIDNFIQKGDTSALVEFLSTNGRVGEDFNLELLRSFLYVLEKKANEKDMNKLWKLALRLAQMPIEKAPTDKQDFVIFVGTWAIGLLAGINPAYIEAATPIIKSLASDPRTVELINKVKLTSNEITQKGKQELANITESAKSTLDKLFPGIIKEKKETSKKVTFMDKIKGTNKKSSKKGNKADKLSGLFRKKKR